MTSFTKKVYQIVLKIPLGQVRTYKWVAQRAGKPKASRAVGQVLKNNPYPLIIPCHRVVRSDNDFGGYIFGRQRKKQILNLEKEIIKCLRNKK